VGGSGDAGAASAAVIAARSVGPALLLCMGTSSIAFLAFVPTAYRGLGELGVISAGGMVIAFTLSLTLVPALFAVIGEPAPRPERPSRRARTLPPSLVLTVTLLLALAATWPASSLRFDYSVLAMRDATTEGMSTLLELQDSGVATDYSISVLAQDAAEAEAIAERLRRLPEVGEVTTPTELVPPAQAEKRALLVPLRALLATLDPVQPANLQDLLPDAVDFLASVREAVPEGDAAAYDAFLAALREMDGAERARLDGELERALETEIAALQRLLAAEPFTLDDAPPSLRSLLITEDGRQLVRVQPAAPITDRERAGAFVAAVDATAPNIAGRTVIEWGVGGVVVASFLQAATLALGTIVLLLLLYFRTLIEPLLVLVPIGLAALFTAAVAELTGLTLNMANILVVPLIFGLGVDTGIHVVHRFSHTGDVAALEASSTPRAVTIAGLTTIGTFLSLSFSPHKGAASIGLLLFIAISLLLLATFVVLPALLTLRQRLRGRSA
ncbi:MAG: MMPL family transporter, partial [Pseudomonadales bacterium]|nr:MMPL family transporter [Pseudomonadales bacterium]